MAVWTDQPETIGVGGEFYFLIDDNFFFLIDDNYKLVIETGGNPIVWTDQSES